MTGAVMYRLNRHRDPSGISGEGDEKATVVEFESGLAVLHWNSDKPSVQVHTDIRHIIDHHGHGGASELVLYENERLLGAYRQVCFWLTREMTTDRLPLSVGPHPDWPDRLLVKLGDERAWAFWTALLDGSTDTATREEVSGRIVTTWVNPEGNLWLSYSVDGTFEDLLAGQDENPLQRFHEEDR
jgi:hypothetical protein